jgi:hypothetical protein
VYGSGKSDALAAAVPVLPWPVVVVSEYTHPAAAATRTA